MDVEPVEAVVGVSLIALALLSVLMVRPNPVTVFPAMREATARSVASTVAYLYVWEYAYGDLDPSEAQAVIENWVDAVSRDSSLAVRVELNLSNGTQILQDSWSYQVGDLSSGDVYVVQKPSPVYLAPNDTAVGEIVFCRDPYGMEVPGGVDPLRLTAVFYDKRSRQPLDVGTVSISAQYTCRTDCPCVNTTICSLIDPSLNGQASEEGFLYTFDQEKSLLTCEDANGTTVALCPIPGPISVTASYSGNASATASGTASLQGVPRALSWLTLSMRNASVGQTVVASYAPSASFRVYSLVDGRVLLTGSGVSLSIDLSDPFEVLPGPLVVEAVDGSFTYRDAFFVRPYIVFTRVSMGGTPP